MKSAQKIKQERDELLSVCVAFSKLYGHLWDFSDESGAGFLSPESVVKYDELHERMSDVIDKCNQD